MNLLNDIECQCTSAVYETERLIRSWIFLGGGQNYKTDNKLIWRIPILLKCHFIVYRKRAAVTLKSSIFPGFMLRKVISITLRLPKGHYNTILFILKNESSIDF